MADMPGVPVTKKKKASRVTRYSALAGAIIGALLARPVIKPWIDAHVSGFSATNWPIFASFVPWILFSFYWEIKDKNSAPAIASESRQSRAVHVVMGNVALLLIILPVRGLSQRFLPGAVLTSLAGLAVEMVGLLLAVWARRVLGQYWSGEISIKAEHKLMRSGPYRVVRHPIYTALLAMYLGTTIVSGQMHALIGLVLALIAYLRKTRLEETNLVNAFGADYIEYRDKTWALLPGVY